LPHQGAFVHRRVYERIGGYRKIFKITLDYDFFYRAFQDGCSLKYENFPIAVMGGGGVSSRVDQQSFSERIREEYRVQKMNESSTLWKIVQFLFHNLYFPYKCKLIPRITNREKPVT